MADPLALAQELLDGACSGREGAAPLAELAALAPETLAAALPDDASRITFWLNTYNATIRARLRDDPAAYRRRWRFFATPAVTVAGQLLSPNDIEHGILRRSAFLVGLGYVRNPFPSEFERRTRVAQLDLRIHFALNCGARSCPPLASWERATLDQDLERATAAYLLSESRRLEKVGRIQVPRLLLWYLGDFGGLAGVKRLLRRHGILGRDENLRIGFGDYDWTLDDATVE